MSELFGVWTPATVLAAIVAGLGFGYIFTDTIIRTAWFASLALPARLGAVLMGVALGGAGVVFYIGQVAATIAGGDSQWPRVLSRFTLWLVCAVFLAVGTYLAAKRDEAKRHARARDKARLEVDK